MKPENSSLNYLDFAYWQTDPEVQYAFDCQLSFWQEELQGELPVLELPADKPRSALLSFEGSSSRVRISDDLVDKLSKLNMSWNLTLFHTLLAAWQLVRGLLVVSRLQQDDGRLVGALEAGGASTLQLQQAARCSALASASYAIGGGLLVHPLRTARCLPALLRGGRPRLREAVFESHTGLRLDRDVLHAQWEADAGSHS